MKLDKLCVSAFLLISSACATIPRVSVQSEMERTLESHISVVGNIVGDSCTDYPRPQLASDFASFVNSNDNEQSFLELAEIIGSYDEADRASGHFYLERNLIHVNNGIIPSSPIFVEAMRHELCHWYVFHKFGFRHNFGNEEEQKIRKLLDEGFADYVANVNSGVDLYEPSLDISEIYYRNLGEELSSSQSRYVLELDSHNVYERGYGITSLFVQKYGMQETQRIFFVETPKTMEELLDILYRSSDIETAGSASILESN